jgi:glycosyltransferase involved in cell wall biosynthesis
LRDVQVLHLVPEVVDDPAQHYLGSTKDVACRTHYLRTRRVDVARVPYARGPRGLAAAIESRRGSVAPDLVLVETIPLDVAVLRRLRGIPVVVRSQNAELLHRLDWARAATGLVSRARYCSRGLRGLARESRLGGATILPISDWEAEHYYRRFVPAGRIEVTPFYLTPEYIDAVPADHPDRRPRLLMLGTTSPNPLIDDGVRAFDALVRGLPTSVAVTPALTGTVPDGLRLDPRIELLGLVPRPIDALRAASHVVLPSPLGYGFKTKILEALLAGCHVLVHEALHRRLPPEVRAACHPVDPTRPETVTGLLAVGPATVDALSVNEALRARSDDALHRVLARAGG